MILQVSKHCKINLIRKQKCHFWVVFFGANDPGGSQCASKDAISSSFL